MIVSGPTTDASSLGRAAEWIGAVVQGPIMTSVAVLAIAALGFAMLRGRLSVRRGATVVLGCFIAFGAPAIARGLVGLAHDQSVREEPAGQIFVAAPPLRFEPPPTAVPPADGDPYAGASVRN